MGCLNKTKGEAPKIIIFPWLHLVTMTFHKSLFHGESKLLCTDTCLKSADAKSKTSESQADNDDDQTSQKQKEVVALAFKAKKRKRRIWPCVDFLQV